MFTSQAFASAAMASSLSTLTSFCLSHMVSLRQPDLIKHSQTVYMRQITQHVLCSTASGVVLQFPSSLVFVSSFPLYTLPHNFITLRFLCSDPLLQLLPLKTTNCYKPISSSSFSLHIVAPSFQWPSVPTFLIFFLVFFTRPTARGVQFGSWNCCIMNS